MLATQMTVNSIPICIEIETVSYFGSLCRPLKRAPIFLCCNRGVTHAPPQRGGSTPSLRLYRPTGSKLRALRAPEQIDKLQSVVSDENLQKVLALKSENTTLQQKLMYECAAYGDYTKYLSYTWRDIQSQLGVHDIAIEFTTVPLSPLDKDNYILALILASTGEPTMAVISTKAIIKNLKSKDDLYDNSQYYNLIWGFMQEHLAGKHNVYFAPDNNLSDIAIEYLNDGHQTFFEKYEVYRLSSTKELCRNYSETNDSKNITIFTQKDL